ncbi:MAG: ribonuclease P protein component [Candidatus Levybacteria bacterium]|nr:ribonuclease P protein component [Candidatus Levybacteria bacterium]
MFKKKYRLSARVYLRQALVIHTLFFTLRIAKSSLPFSRFGFVVSKKIDQRSVVRNKVKRKVRLCIEELITRIKGGYDMLFYIKNRAVEDKQMIICKETQRVFEENKLLI